MFGTNNNQATDQTVTAPPMPPQSVVAPGQPPAESAPIVPVPPPGPAPVDPVVHPTEPQDSSGLATPAPDAGATAPELPKPAPSPEITQLHKPSVNLENAYIPADPPNMPADDSSSKPTAASIVNAPNDDELLDIKQQALQSLAPMVDDLDQTPEERFKTLMMLIQASDNAELVKDAYDAANQIKDEKAKAQALLDVVNEINYFTHHQENSN